MSFASKGAWRLVCEAGLGIRSGVMVMEWGELTGTEATDVTVVWGKLEMGVWVGTFIVEDTGEGLGAGVLTKVTVGVGLAAGNVVMTVERVGAETDPFSAETPRSLSSI